MSIIWNGLSCHSHHLPVPSGLTTFSIRIPGFKLEVVILSHRSGGFTVQELVDHRAFVTSLFVKLDIAPGGARGGIIHFSNYAVLHQALTYVKNDALVRRSTTDSSYVIFVQGLFLIVFVTGNSE